MSTWIADDLIGMPVVGAKGRIFGSVESVQLEIPGWQVTSLKVKVAASSVRDLGLKKPFLRRARVDIGPDKVASVRDVILLKLSLEEFGSLVKAASVPRPTPEARKKD